MAVLIISADGDWSADAVAEELARRGVPHARLDPATFPQRLTMAAEMTGRWHGTFTGAGGHWIELAEVSAVYYRRPADFAMPDGMSGPELRFARAQARVGVGGVLASLHARWINHPSALADAEYKPRQLAVAAAVGLSVPPTLVTNDAEAVRSFAGRIGDLVVKPLADPIVEEDGTYTAVWTRRLGPDGLDDLEGVEHTAHLFQQWVPKAYEVRLTIVGRHRFPVAIHAGTPESHVDWRRDYDALTYQTIECPGPVLDATDRFLTRFGLTYGAFDFVVDPAGRWWFLECNGAGQWGWLAEECALPIAAAIAEELTKE